MSFFSILVKNYQGNLSSKGNYRVSAVTGMAPEEKNEETPNILTKRTLKLSL